MIDLSDARFCVPTRRAVLRLYELLSKSAFDGRYPCIEIIYPYLEIGIVVSFPCLGSYPFLDIRYSCICLGIVLLVGEQRMIFVVVEDVLSVSSWENPVQEIEISSYESVS